MKIEAANHSAEYIANSDFVVLGVSEFNILAERSEARVQPHHLVGRDGEVTHIVLFSDDYENLISLFPPPELTFKIEMKRKRVRAEALVSADPGDPWVKVFAGSTFGKIEKSLEKPYRLLRRQLHDKGVVSAFENAGYFHEHYTFDNPSEAARFVVGSPESGNVFWKDQRGRTLDECGLGVRRHRSR